MERDKIVIAKPRTFAREAIERGATYYDYQNFVNLIWSQGSNYVCERKIGRGKYSEVFEAVNVNNNCKCVVKMLKPSTKHIMKVKFKKINRQVKILMALQGKNNTIELLDIIREGEIYCLVFEYVSNCDYKKFLEVLTPKDCKYYLYQLLKGLNYCHSLGIIHRDIKPQNVMIDHDKKKLRIIDWGLGQFYLPQKDYNVRVSSRYYKAPQLLVNYEYYHYSLDIWSLGVMMAGMIFNKQPFFKGGDNYDQLQKINKVLGIELLYDYLNKYNIPLDQTLERILGQHKPVKLNTYVTESNKHLATPDALNLLCKMMQYDHELRPTAEECMRHSYFDEVRNT